MVGGVEDVRGTEQSGDTDDNARASGSQWRGGGPRGWGFGHALWLDASGVGAGVGKVPVWVAGCDSFALGIAEKVYPFVNTEFAASTIVAFAVQSSE